jgi:hypothetical protein
MRLVIWLAVAIIAVTGTASAESVIRMCLQTARSIIDQTQPVRSIRHHNRRGLILRWEKSRQRPREARRRDRSGGGGGAAVIVGFIIVVAYWLALPPGRACTQLAADNWLPNP